MRHPGVARRLHARWIWLLLAAVAGVLAFAAAGASPAQAGVGDTLGGAKEALSAGVAHRTHSETASPQSRSKPAKQARVTSSAVKRTADASHRAANSVRRDTHRSLTRPVRQAARQWPVGHRVRIDRAHRSVPSNPAKAKTSPKTIKKTVRKAAGETTSTALTKVSSVARTHAVDPAVSGAVRTERTVVRTAGDVAPYAAARIEVVAEAVSPVLAGVRETTGPTGPTEGAALLVRDLVGMVAGLPASVDLLLPQPLSPVPPAVPSSPGPVAPSTGLVVLLRPSDQNATSPVRAGLRAWVSPHALNASAPGVVRTVGTAASPVDSVSSRSAGADSRLSAPDPDDPVSPDVTGGPHGVPPSTVSAGAAGGSGAPYACENAVGRALSAHGAAAARGIGPNGWRLAIAPRFSPD